MYSVYVDSLLCYYVQKDYVTIYILSGFVFVSFSYVITLSVITTNRKLDMKQKYQLRKLDMVA